MPLINCKIELNLKWTNYCVLSADGANNANNKDDNNIFTTKDTKLYVPVATLSAEHNQNLPKLLSKGFERSVYWNEYKTKSENKNTSEYSYFFESNFAGANWLFVLVCFNKDNDLKQFNAQKHYLTKEIIVNYNVAINGKNL